MKRRTFERGDAGDSSGGQSGFDLPPEGLGPSAQVPVPGAPPSPAGPRATRGAATLLVLVALGALGGIVFVFVGKPQTEQTEDAAAAKTPVESLVVVPETAPHDEFADRAATTSSQPQPGSTKARTRWPSPQKTPKPNPSQVKTVPPASTPTTAPSITEQLTPPPPATASRPATTKGQLLGKMNRRTATMAELQMLKGLCMADGDRACRNAAVAAMSRLNQSP